MSTQRDPRVDPRAGDTVVCAKGARRVIEVRLGAPFGSSNVRARDITYVSDRRTGRHTCWIGTWQDWCHRNKVDVTEIGKDPS